MTKKKLQESRPFAIHFTEKSRTKQSFKNQCDMNQIIQSLNRGNLLGHVTNKTPQYGNVPASFHEIQNAIATAKTEFEELPEELRSRFEGVEDYVDALIDPERQDEFKPDTDLESDQENSLEADSEASDTPEKAQQEANDSENSG